MIKTNNTVYKSLIYKCIYLVCMAFLALMWITAKTPYSPICLQLPKVGLTCPK